MSLILIADDDDLHAGIVADALREIGHVIELASDGLHALSAMRQKAFDAIVLDCEMPQMTGYQVLQSMRGDARLANIPVLMLTARCAKRDRQLARLEGAASFLVKPAALNLVIERVHSLLARKTEVYHSPIYWQAPPAEKARRMA